MRAILFQNPVAELRNVFWPAVSIEVEIIQKGVFVEAFEDLVGEIVVFDRQSMCNDVLDRVDTEISIDSLQPLTSASGLSFEYAGKQIAIEQRLDLHMPDQQFKSFVGSQVFDAKGQDSIDQSFFETPGGTMEKKL